MVGGGKAITEQQEGELNSATSPVVVATFISIHHLPFSLAHLPICRREGTRRQREICAQQTIERQQIRDNINWLP
jgi:hypothetical protein